MSKETTNVLAIYATLWRNVTRSYQQVLASVCQLQGKLRFSE